MTRQSPYMLYMIIPFISAFIGYLTNYLAVRMIFRPRKEINFFGIKIMGLIPRRKSALADKIADTVERELISHNDLRIIASSPEFHDLTGALIKSRIDSFIDRKVASNPLLTMFLSQDVASRISELLVEEMKKNMPDILEGLFSSLEDNFNFRTIIREKIERFEMARLEKIVYDISARELKTIEYLGGVLGFVVGVVQVGILIIWGN